MLFKKSAKHKKIEFDPARKQPVIRCSICTGEQVAGFKDLHTGQFEEIMKLNGEEDRKTFEEMCGVKEIKKEY